MTQLPSPNTLRDWIGQEVGVSPWLTITQDMVNTFASVTGDQQWIHVDPDRARQESPFGTTIAHGFFTLALVSQLHDQAVQIGGLARVINYGLNRVRFPAPVRVGSAVRSRSLLQSVEEKEGALQVVWQITVEISGETKPALVAEWLLRLYRP
jgi:acyl dehydratase